MRKLRLISVLALVLALAFVPAGCGKDADNDSTGGKVPDIFDNDTPAGNDTPAPGGNTPAGDNNTPVTPDPAPGGNTPTPDDGTIIIDPVPGGSDTPDSPIAPTVCIEHTFEEAERKDNTCTVDGEVKYVCKVCQTIQYERVYANHKVENNKCTLCGLEAATNLMFALTADGKAFEVEDIGSYGSSDVIVPSHVAGLPVVRVLGLKDARRVHLPDTVTEIGDRAFEDGRLENIYIPNSVAIIGESAFEGCKELSRIKLPDSVAFIGARAFKYCNSLSEIRIPDAVTEFSDEMLYNCRVSLESLGDLSRVVYFGSRFWRPNAPMDTLTLPEDATLAPYAFENWNISEIVLPSTLTEIPEGLFADSRITVVTIPNGVKTIGKMAFDGCNGLTSATLPEGITYIGESAFGACSSLTGIKLPDSIEIIGVRAFEDCRSMDLTVLPASLKEIGIEAFRETGIKNLTLPEGLTHIGQWAFSRSDLETVVFNGAEFCGDAIFQECSKLTNVTIGANVKEIPTAAFAGTNLFFVTIPASVEKIGESAFYECRNLQRVTFEEGVKVIDIHAFAYCTNLKAIILPQSVRTFGEAAFRACAIEKITLPAGLETVGTGLFYECEKLSHVYCAAEKPLFDPETLRVYERGSRIENSFSGEIVLGATGE